MSGTRREKYEHICVCLFFVSNFSFPFFSGGGAGGGKNPEIPAGEKWGEIFASGPGAGEMKTTVKFRKSEDAIL